MSFTNKTPNYELPQWLADDKPTFLSDMNGAFSDIDTAMKANENAAASAQSTADANTLSINGITTDLDGAGGVKARLSAVETAESNLEGSVNTINSLIGNGTPTTTDQTIIGAINEIVAFTGEGPLDTTAQTVTGAINELAAGGGGSATLEGLTDVDITSPANGDALVYDSANQKWINQAGGIAGGGNLKFNGNKVFTATADGTKTNATLAGELLTEIGTYLAAQSNAYRFQILAFIIPAVPTYCPSSTGARLYDKSNNTNWEFFDTAISPTGPAIHYRKLATTPIIRFWDGSTVTDQSAVVPANATTMTVTIAEYEIV